MSIRGSPLELPCGQRVDSIVFGMRANEFHKGYLPAKVEGGHQAIVSTGNLEPDALAVQHLGTRRRFADLVRGHPMRGPDKFVPAFERNLCYRVVGPTADERIS